MKKSPNIEKMAVSRAASRAYRWRTDRSERRERSGLKKRAHKRARRSFKEQIINFLKGEVDIIAYTTNTQVGARDVI